MAARTVNVTDIIDRSKFTALQKRTVLFCLLLAISDGLNSLSVGYAIPGLAELWDIAPGAFSVVIVAAIVGEIIASVTLAPLADRFGRKAIIAVGITLFGVSTLLAAFAPSLIALVICRFASGVGIGTASPNLFALGSDFAPGKFKATIVTIIGTGMALGGAICGIVAGFAVPAFGVQSIFLIAGAIPLLALMIVAAFLPDSVEMYARRGKTAEAASILNTIDPTTQYSAHDDYLITTTDQTSGRTVTQLFAGGRKTSTVLVWAMLLLSITGSYFVFSWLTTLLVMADVAQSTAIFATSITTFGGIIGGILIGMAIDRSRLGVGSLCIGIVIQVITTYALIATLGSGGADRSAWVIALCFVLGFGIIGTGTATTAVVAQVYPPTLKATGIGWAAGVSRIGAIIAPLVGGALVDSGISVATMLQVSLIPAVLNAVLILLFLRYGRLFTPATSTTTAGDPFNLTT